MKIFEENVVKTFILVSYLVVPGFGDYMVSARNAIDPLV